MFELLKEWESQREGEAERERLISIYSVHLLIHSPREHKCRIWTKAKSRVWDFLWVLHWVAKNQILRPSLMFSQAH